MQGQSERCWHDGPRVELEREWFGSMAHPAAYHFCTDPEPHGGGRAAPRVAVCYRDVRILHSALPCRAGQGGAQLGGSFGTNDTNRLVCLQNRGKLNECAAARHVDR